VRFALAIVIPLAAALLQGSVVPFVSIAGARPNLPVLVAGDLDQISDQLHRASLWVTNPNINSVGLPAADQASRGPVIRDISDVVF